MKLTGKEVYIIIESIVNISKKNYGYKFVLRETNKKLNDNSIRGLIFASLLKFIKKDK